MGVLLWMVLACAKVPADPPATPTDSPSESMESAAAGDGYVLRGGTVVGLGPADVWLLDGRIEAVGEVEPGPVEVDVTGQYLVPAFIDSHVHLAYYEVSEALADAGVAAAVDWAAPMAFLDERPAVPLVLASGPMVTAVGGYPTRSWGSDGYGLEVSGAEAAAAAVDTLAEAGVEVIKVPITGTAVLTDAELAAVVGRAAELELPVGAHALGADEAERAAEAGVDVLVHVPTETLPAPTVAALADTIIVATLSAFGGGNAAVSNLAALRQAGATVLYGTDLGNSREVAIQSRELALMEEAGMSAADILAAGTSVPAAWWGLDELGAIEAGRAASLLVLDADPLEDIATVASPAQVWIAGEPRDD